MICVLPSLQPFVIIGVFGSDGSEFASESDRAEKLRCSSKISSVARKANGIGLLFLAPDRMLDVASQDGNTFRTAKLL
jgi:hypothetical protein